MDETQDRIVIEGTEVYDGTFECDLSHFTLGEFRRIKQVANIARGQILDALANDDTDLWVAFAVVALERNGASYVEPDVFWNAKDARITLIEGKAPKGDEGPPAQAGSESTGPDGTSDINGPSSAGASAPSPEDDPSLTGAGSSG